MRTLLIVGMLIYFDILTINYQKIEDIKMKTLNYTHECFENTIEKIIKNINGDL
jgi:hypothetical protein